MTKIWPKVLIGAMLGAGAYLGKEFCADIAALTVVPNAGEFLRARGIDTLLGAAPGGAIVGALASPAGWVRTLLCAGLAGVGGGSIAKEVRLSIGLAPGRTLGGTGE